MNSIRHAVRVVKSLLPATVPLLLAALALLPRLAWGQEDDLGYPNVYATVAQVVKTLMHSAAYLLVYAAALTLTLKSLNRFFEFDALLLTWIGALWLGGMAANALAYAVAGSARPWLAALVALPLIFGWTLFLCTRSWADLLLAGALRVAVVTALVCAPYFGPTWHVGVR
ncbi:MAG TPA: hypothetical protein PLZ36_00575 [Armatimonadota bacterium]|nr:hypothetical protein [Armatimonadota bacterium]HOS42492.1 hypothetical protein [Armatimonadota bacterium]